tara:strand:- start:147975 stop:148184 length:210 start_codon:yes stop_codon:yes gene_type:complete
MTIQNENSIAIQNPRLLKRIWNWLVKFDQAMNYDPQAYAYSRMNHHSKEIAALNLKLKQIEVAENGRIE